jgi:hypothetical protein
MTKRELHTTIIKKIIEIEKKNIYNGFPKSKKQMEAEIEVIIQEEVDKYENFKAKA